MSDWQPISTYAYTTNGRPYSPHVLCGHDTKNWIRMGRFEAITKRWYYSGTNERSQWAQVEGDEPTHWQPLPDAPVKL